jgi:hypothetical protein
MTYLDNHKDVIEWQSEEFFIPYKSIIDGSYHKYYPDFKVRYKDKQGKVRNVVFEIKPSSQRVPPKQPSKKSKKYIREVVTYGTNLSKWKAAKEYCADRGWEFKLLSEQELFDNGRY